MSEKRKLVTSEVALRLGITRKALIMFILRNADLKPAERLPNEDFLWSESEIERLIERRQRRKVTAS